MGEEGHRDADERAEALAMPGTILFCAVGGGVGIMLGLCLVPRLLRDRD